VDAALVATRVNDGYHALATGEWAKARDAFEAAANDTDGADPEILDGLGRALWWQRDTAGAVATRERAYAGFRREGDLARAARIALWLSREYALAWRNDAASNGWLARAERLLNDVAPGVERGWLDLARAERARTPQDAATLAMSALEAASAAADADLEVRALAQLGLSEVQLGRVDEGLRHFDEAMASATAGEPSLETFADVCCSLMLACDLADDDERPKQWSQVVDAFLQRYDHVPLLAFCRTCCADVYAATGRVDDAEQELLAAIRELSEAGQRSRCAHPSARLAEIRVLQGRFEEADELLRGFEDEPEAIDAAIAIRLARDEPRAAIALIEQRLAGDGTTVLAAPLLARLVEATLADGDLQRARSVAEDLDRLALTSGRDRIAATAALARGRVAAANGDADATDILRDAETAFVRLRLPLDAARARLELAQALAPGEPDLAVDVARRASADLAALGADREAGLAAALLRTLGAKARAGPKAIGLLTKRELEVLRLLAEGLSNQQIAKRLYISPKTAEHHLSRIYAKLDVGGRTEATAYAVRHLGPE
jgi:DNA-binding CsgD family transcriptional regulator